MQPQLIALAAAAGLLLAGSGAASAFDLGIVAFQMSSETHARCANAAKAAAKEKGWTATVLNSNGALPTHAQQIEDLTQKKVNGIILCMSKPVQLDAQLASAKNEDVAKSTWARLQAANGDVLSSLRMQPTKVDLGDKGVWYRVQAGPLDEKQAHSICGTLKSRKTDCVAVAPAKQ